MSRRWLGPLVLVAVLSGCTSSPRPEGVVERWLLSLNKGAAGRPDLYATEAASAEVVPGWRDLDPGQLDRIEVGRPTPSPGRDLGGPGRIAVPFTVVRTDGSEVEADAILRRTAEGTWTVTGILPDVQTGGTAPSVAGLRPSIAEWLVAVGIGLTLALLAVGLVMLVRRTAATSSAG